MDLGRDPLAESLCSLRLGLTVHPLGLEYIVNTTGTAEPRISPCVEQSIGFNFGPANGNTSRVAAAAPVQRSVSS
jgi:hypothetical protein